MQAPQRMHLSEYHKSFMPRRCDRPLSTSAMRSLVTWSQNLVLLLAVTASSSNFGVGRTEPTTPSAVGARRPSTCALSSIWMTEPLRGRNSEYG